MFRCVKYALVAVASRGSGVSLGIQIMKPFRCPGEYSNRQDHHNSPEKCYRPQRKIYPHHNPADRDIDHHAYYFIFPISISISNFQPFQQGF